MIVYPLDFHRRAEQKWARRLKSEVSCQGPISSGNVPRKRAASNNHRVAGCHSSSASRFTAGASGFLNFNQSRVRPET